MPLFRAAEHHCAVGYALAGTLHVYISPALGLRCSAFNVSYVVTSVSVRLVSFLKRSFFAVTGVKKTTLQLFRATEHRFDTYEAFNVNALGFR